MMLTFAMAGTAQADPVNGANGDYCPSGVDLPSGNGTATNKPAAGAVGNADDKNPPGQAPDGSDANDGSEGDGRQAGGQTTNPRYCGCDYY